MARSFVRAPLKLPVRWGVTQPEIDMPRQWSLRECLQRSGQSQCEDESAASALVLDSTRFDSSGAAEKAHCVLSLSTNSPLGCTVNPPIGIKPDFSSRRMLTVC